MNGSVSCLTPDRLRQLSANELTPPELLELEEHVSFCENCRCALEEAAAEPGWRQEVRDALVDCLGTEGWSHLADFTAEDGPPDSWGDMTQIRKLLGPTDDPRMLGRIGPYEVAGILGRGGMGVVFKGFDGALNRYVAIKALLPHLAASGAARKRFAREAQAAAAVVHDHVMAIHSVAEWQGVPYLVMPYARGVSLQKRLSDHGPLEVREILRIGMQTAAGLAAAHAQGLVHRDVKPANIMLDDGVERVTLTDFGLARAVDDASLTRIGTLAGTPQYMSPEQAHAKAVDARSDLFSLGSVLYTMCTGRSPFRADSSYGVLRLITDHEPTPIREINPEIPEWLCAIVSRLMAKQPEDRPSSAGEVAKLLENCLAHVQQPTVVPLPSELSQPRVKPVSRRHKHLFAGVLIMVATLALGLVAVLAWQGTAPPDIAGKWTGNEWGEVVLNKSGDAEYEGTYSDTFGKQGGKIQLKWSRIERRFNGTWREGEDRFGELSVRLVGDEIHGALTTDPKSKINPATPRLADLSWVRGTAVVREFKDATFGPAVEREPRNREAIDFDTGKLAMIPDAELDPKKGLLWILEQRLASLTKWMDEEKMDAVSEGSSLTAFGLKVNELASSDWDTMSPAKLREALKVNWQKENPREFLRAIDTIDPEAPPHAVLALRTRPRTIAFQTREGSMGILQIMEITKAGLKVRFKRIDPTASARAGEIRRGGRVLSASHPEASPIPSQIWIAAPEDMLVAVADERGLFDKSRSLKVPARLNLAPGKTHQLKITDIAGREGLELYPTVEIGPTTARTEAFLAHNVIPIQFTDEDFDQVVAGNLVIKVIYLPDPEFQDLALTGVETLVNTRLDPGKDPIAEADRRGSILAVIRLGNKDVEHMGRGGRMAPASEESVGQAKAAEPVELSELAAAAKQFNTDTAQVRKELFTPPIPDLTVERLRTGFRQSADYYRRHGKEQIADGLQKIADTGRFPKEASGGLIGTGVHARDDDGQTVSRQIVPGLVLLDNSTTPENQLVVLRPLELIYRKDGPVSKDYGDLFEEEKENRS